MRDTDRTEVSYRHKSFVSAKQEAQRLANQHGGRFFVLKVEGCAEECKSTKWVMAESELIPPQFLDWCIHRY